MGWDSAGLKVFALGSWVLIEVLSSMFYLRNMAVSVIPGTPMYYNPHYKDSPNGTPHLGNPPPYQSLTTVAWECKLIPDSWKDLESRPNPKPTLLKGS